MFSDCPNPVCQDVLYFKIEEQFLRLNKLFGGIGMVSIEKIVRASSLEEAYELNQDRKRVVIGGYMWMKMGNRNIAEAIDLSGLGLDTIEETGEEFRIGCMCSLRSLELHEGIDREFGGFIREAVHHIIGVQFRNGATVGGSIYGRYGFSDVLTSLLALDTHVELYKGGIVPLKEFVQMKPDTDILVRVIVKKDGRKASYKSQRNTRTDFPVIAAAVAMKGSTVYVSVGARPSKAGLIESNDSGLVAGSSAEEILKFSEWARDQFTYGSDMRAGGDYRKHLASVYIRRGITELLGGEKA
jgi:CO/xanthine dehydrogenase FAD-binding subunit